MVPTIGYKEPQTTQKPRFSLVTLFVNRSGAVVKLAIWEINLTDLKTSISFSAQNSSSGQKFSTLATKIVKSVSVGEIFLFSPSVTFQNLEKSTKLEFWTSSTTSSSASKEARGLIFKLSRPSYVGNITSFNERGRQHDWKQSGSLGSWQLLQIFKLW